MDRKIPRFLLTKIQVHEVFPESPTRNKKQDSEIMKLLGDEPVGNDNVFGNAVHQAFAVKKYLSWN